MRSVCVALALLLVAVLEASQSYHPPGSGEAWTGVYVYLKGLKGAKAQGVVAFLCNHAEGQHRVQVYAKGLQAGQAYSLWLRRFERGELVQEKRVTRRLFSPETDTRGVFREVVSVRGCPLALYNDVVVVHGTNDTSDGVLFGKITVAADGDLGDEVSGPPRGGE